MEAIKSESLTVEEFKRRQSIDGYINLLAQEKITVVRHSKATACFDLKNRIMYVPNWNFTAMGCESAELLMDAHEVGHALYTPDSHTVNACRNILEDNRIERMLKRAYPGLRKVFAEGYRQLHEVLNFFELKDRANQETIRSMNLLDKINIHSKLGHLVYVDFSPEERVFMDKANVTQSFEDILALEEEIKEYMKKQDNASEKSSSEQQPGQKAKDDNQPFGDEDDLDDMVPPPMFDEEPGESDSSSDSSDSIDDNEDTSTTEGKKESTSSSKDDSADEEETEEESSNDAGSSADTTKKTEESSPQKPADFEFESDTLSSFDKKTEDVINKAGRTPRAAVIGSVNKAELETVGIIEINTTLDNLVTYESLGFFNHSVDIVDSVNHFDPNYALAKRQAKVLYKEFMLRKNAKDRRMDRTENTGRLDVKKLAKYKLTENIFKSATVRYDGINHGFIFLVDASGSMSGNTMRATIMQLFIVTEFCRLMNIKYRVFTFTSGTRTTSNPLGKMFDSGNASITGGDYASPALIEILSSEVTNNSNVRLCNAAWYTLAVSNGRNYNPTPACRAKGALTYNIKDKNSEMLFSFFSGTSTVHALALIEPIAKQFFESNRIEKRNLILMTDGGAGDRVRISSLDNEITKGQEISIRHTSTTADIVIDAKTGKKYTAEGDHSGIMLDILRNRLMCNTIYMQLAKTVRHASESSQIVSSTMWDRDAEGKPVYKGEQAQYQMTRQKFAKIKHKYISSAFIINMPKIDGMVDFEDVLEDAEQKSAAQIASKIVSANKSERQSRVLMQSLAESFN